MSASNHDEGLAPYAALEAGSRGRRHREPPPAHRGEFQRDRDRIVHSSGFRRLVYKTQVFVNHEGDLYRTRLTHSLEVAQIARTIAKTLDLNETLAEAISLAHDLGHTAFGHAGQDALNECMKVYGGFEHNLQSLRVVDRLEEKYADFQGLNLMFETREGILKHCSAKNARELGDVGERFLARTSPGLEAQLVNLADEIAYNNHDVDDGLRAGLLDMDELKEVALFGEQYEIVAGRYPDLKARRLIHEIVRRMIGRVVNDVIDASRRSIADAAPRDIDAVRALPALIGFGDVVAAQHAELKKFLNIRLYQHEKVQTMTTKARRTTRELFEAFFGDVDLMPAEFAAAAKAAREEAGDAGRARVVADYIAGMTDRYAISAHERLMSDARMRRPQ